MLLGFLTNLFWLQLTHDPGKILETVNGAHVVVLAEPKIGQESLPFTSCLHHCKHVIYINITLLLRQTGRWIHSNTFPNLGLYSSAALSNTDDKGDMYTWSVAEKTPMIHTHLHQGALIRLQWRVINRLDLPEWSCYKWALSRLSSTSKWVFSLRCPRPEMQHQRRVTNDRY